MSAHGQENGKAAPAATPFVPAALSSKLREAVDKPAARRDVRVRLEVEGGRHDERYEFRFDAVGSGAAEVMLRCRLKERAFEPKNVELTAQEITGLLRAVDVDRLLEAANVRPQIPPDSLVGRLHVSDGGDGVTVLFMADEEQARTAGYEAPPAVAKLVDKIYRLGAKALGTRDVRP